MYAAEFDYVRASSIEEAISLKRENDESSVLAGGHSIIPAMKLRLSTPKKLIDISGLSQLKNISNLGNYISIGALCTHRQCAASDLIQKNCPALSDAASVIGDPHVRNKGTIGERVPPRLATVSTFKEVMVPSLLAPTTIWVE